MGVKNVAHVIFHGTFDQKSGLSVIPVGQALRRNSVQGNVPKSHEVKDDALVEETSSHPRYSVKKLMKLIHVTNTRQLSEIKPGQQSNTAGTWILKYFLESCRPFGPGDPVS